MAINIQEILHPSDSDSIKFSKINYNFDQILANGGGPIGPKGAKGSQGVVGQTGQKGEIGDKGIKGDSGETTSPWKSIAIDLDTLDGVNNVTILKPKPSTDLETPTIWLGDSSFINDSNQAGDGDVSLRSTLNVSRHYNFNSSAVEAEYVTLWHDADNKIVIDSENVNTGSAFVRYNISPVQPLVGSAPDIRLQINTPTIHTETFQLDNQSASGALSSGMVRYNSGGNKFEGYINNAWVEFCMDPCGSGGVSGTISISGGNLNLNSDGTLSGDSISISAGDLDLNADGTVVSNISTTTYTLSFLKSGNINLNDYQITSGQLVANSNGVTQNGSTSTTGNGGIGFSIEGNDGDSVEVEIVTQAGSGLEFDPSPFTIGGSTGFMNTIVSQTLSNNDTTCTIIISGTLATSQYGSTSSTNYFGVPQTSNTSVTGQYSVNYGGSTADVCAGTSNTNTATGLSVTVNNTSPTAQQWRDAAEVAAATYLSSNYPNQLLVQGGYFKVISITNHQGTTVLAPTNWCELDAGSIGDSGECATGTASYYYATSSANACDPNNATGSRSNVDVPLPADLTSHTQWLDQAQAASGIHHANADLTIANVNPWLAVYEIFDHLGVAIQPIGDETVLVQPTSGNISQLVACSTTAPGPGGPPSNA